MSGSVRWSVAGKWQAEVALYNGGSIATDDSGTAFTFDAGGGATGMMASLPIQSWTGSTYQKGSIESLFVGVIFDLASTFWAFQGGNYSKSATAATPLPDRVYAVSDVVQPDPFGPGSVLREITYALYQGRNTYPPQDRAVIQEHLNITSFSGNPSDRPKESASDPGKRFEDQVGTRGKGDFTLIQRFYARLPKMREFPIKIIQCIDTNRFGKEIEQNKIQASNAQIQINEDSGSTTLRTCRVQ